MSVAIGIDLGTTNTVVAAVVDGVAVTLEDEQGRRLLPSVVSFHPSGTVLVGDAAKERRLIDPENTIFSIKPLLGRPWDSDEVKAALGRFPFALVAGAKNATMVTARDVAYALPEISAFVLRRAKAIAEAALKQPVDRAVVTVPANFNDLQRASTKIAGKLAGLDVMRILNEPTAAALAYGQSIAKAEKIGVYDLGGGTFDITLLDLTGNVFEVLATAGDTALGGDDIDRLLGDKLALEVIKKYNYDPRTNPIAQGRLRFIAEEMKKELSAKPSVTRDIGGIGYTEGGAPIEMSLTLSREELERVALPLVERTISVARQSIEIIGMHPKDFDRVILVGGSTRMPMVPRMVEHLFGQPPHLKVNPDEVVALGAAIQAHALNRSKAAKQPKRASAHDQLAKARAQENSERQKSQPPTVNPVPANVEVPKAPPLPAGLSGSVPQSPQFFAFSKAPAVITFSPPPPGVVAADAPDAPQQDPAAAHNATAGGGRKTIEGKPARSGVTDAPATGPKPARTSVAPRAGAGASAPLVGSRGVSGAYGSAAPPAPAAEAEEEELLELVPDLDIPERRPSDFGAVVAAGDFFPDVAHTEGSPLPGPQPRPQRQPEPPPQHQPQPIDSAAFQRGSAIATAENAPLLIDVTPLSLRVETVGGYSDVLITANTAVPCEKSRAFRTASDRQTVVFIRVAQGESPRFAENTYLGELELSGLKAAARGGVTILVTFELDADGILNVRAKDKDTGRETKAQMKVTGASSEASDIEAMLGRQARHVVA